VFPAQSSLPSGPRKGYQPLFPFYINTIFFCTWCQDDQDLHRISVVEFFLKISALEKCPDINSDALGGYGIASAPAAWASPELR
jgi:hypothetical protein